MLTARDIAIIRKVFNEEFDRKFDERIIEIRNDIAMFKDEIISVLHPLQEDHTVLGSHVREIWGTVENHEGRIVTLELSHPHQHPGI